MKYFKELPKCDNETICFVTVYKDNSFACAVGFINENKFYMINAIYGRDISVCRKEISDFINSSDKSLVECYDVWFNLFIDIRNETEKDTRILKEASNMQLRIDATSELINKTFYFDANYDNSENYISFVENLLDCKKGESIQAANCLSGLCAYLQRNYNLK